MIPKSVKRFSDKIMLKQKARIARPQASPHHDDNNRGNRSMSKLRHIAIIVEDPEASAKFFEEAFDMKRAGTARRGIYMSDGIFNVALLKKENEKEKLGLYHFGMWVDNLDEAEKKVVDAGGEYLAGRPTSPNSFYEAKYKSPTGLVFDLTHTGWAGAVKDVVPQK
jgi:predicted enzyme related to lactoylglutathione lyase